MPRISFVRDFLPPLSPPGRDIDPLTPEPLNHGGAQIDEEIISRIQENDVKISQLDENLADIHLEFVEEENRRRFTPSCLDIIDDGLGLESEADTQWDERNFNEENAHERTFSAESDVDIEAGPTLHPANSTLGPPALTQSSSKRHKRGPNKKGKAQATATLRTWLKIDQNGNASMLQTDKWRITHKLGIQTRDMRLLDPNLSTAYTSAMLCREKAIIVSMEHIKVIITTSYVLVINHEEEKVARFVENLKRRLKSSAEPNMAAKPPASRRPSGVNVGAHHGGMELSSISTVAAAAEKLRMYISPSSMGLELPFELKVLEVCLDVTAGHLDFLTTELESAAYPALDALMRKVNSQHLERVRRIKNALVRLTRRVEVLRGLINKFMDDDGDMHDLNLTAKEMHEEEERRQLKTVDSNSRLSLALGLGLAAEFADPSQLKVRSSSSSSSSSSSRSSNSSNSSVEEAETAVVEMLLETYFMNLDNTFNKLQTLDEYVGDTEDLVNIQLDQHRNRLITVDLMLTGYMAACSTCSSISGWFGMNLANNFMEVPHAFLEVVLSSSIGCIVLVLIFFLWLWKRKLI